MELLIDLLERCEKLDIRGWYRAKEELAALREAGEKMTKIYTHLPKEIRNESNVYYQILLSGVEAIELMDALEAWEAANK